MPRLARASTVPDMNRISAGVSRPGIDPRIWCSYGYAKDESMLDEEHGDFLDVVLLPSQLEVTVRVPQTYAGKEFGNNDGRIHKDDEVVIVFPDGDPSSGGFVSARFWSKADPPPKLVKDYPKDIVRVIEKDINLRYEFVDGKALATMKIGDFDVTIDNSESPTTATFKTDDGNVFKLTKDGLELGVNPSDKMALASLVKNEIQKVRDTLNGLVTTFNAHQHPVTSAPGTSGPPTSPGTAPASVSDVKSDFVTSK